MRLPLYHWRFVISFGIHGRRAFISATLAFTALSTIALAAINPIPGVDVIVKKNPGGNAVSVKTDKNGQFTVRGLAPGRYDLTWSVPANTAAWRFRYNQTKDAPSSTRRKGVAVGDLNGDGKPALTIANRLSHDTQLVIVTISVRTDSSGRLMSGSTADTHQTIVITAKQGAITGTANR